MKQVSDLCRECNGM